jgi:hypothetical protein
MSLSLAVELALVVIPCSRRLKYTVVCFPWNGTSSRWIHLGTAMYGDWKRQLCNEWRIHIVKGVMFMLLCLGHFYWYIYAIVPGLFYWCICASFVLDISHCQGCYVYAAVLGSFLLIHLCNCARVILLMHLCFVCSWYTVLSQLYRFSNFVEAVQFMCLQFFISGFFESFQMEALCWCTHISCSSLAMKLGWPMC